MRFGKYKIDITRVKSIELVSLDSWCVMYNDEGKCEINLPKDLPTSIMNEVLNTWVEYTRLREKRKHGVMHDNSIVKCVEKQKEVRQSLQNNDTSNLTESLCYTQKGVKQEDKGTIRLLMHAKEVITNEEADALMAQGE